MKRIAATDEQTPLFNDYLMNIYFLREEIEQVDDCRENRECRNTPAARLSHRRCPGPPPVVGPQHGGGNGVDICHVLVIAGLVDGQCAGSEVLLVPAQMLQKCTERRVVLRTS